MITSIEDLLHCPVLSGCAFWSLFLLSLLRLLNGRIRPGRPRAAAHLIQKELRGGLPTTADMTVSGPVQGFACLSFSIFTSHP